MSNQSKHLSDSSTVGMKKRFRTHRNQNNRKFVDLTAEMGNYTFEIDEPIQNGARWLSRQLNVLEKKLQGYLRYFEQQYVCN